MVRQFLRDARSERNLTMREAAELVGISPSHYSMIECGQRDPSGKVAIRLSTTFCVSVESFYPIVHSNGI